MEDIASIAATLIGLLVLYRSRRRRFQRTNQFGVEVFPSYLSKLTNRFIDEILFAAGIVLLGIGSISLGLKYAGGLFSLLILLLAGIVIEHIFLDDRRKLNHVKQIK